MVSQSERSRRSDETPSTSTSSLEAVGNMDDRLTYDIKTASRLIGISTSLGYELARRGEFPGCIRLGVRRFVVSKAILHRFLNGDGQHSENTILEAVTEQGKAP